MFCLNFCQRAFFASLYGCRGSRCSPPGRQLRSRRSPSPPPASRAASRDSHSLPRSNHFITAEGFFCFRRFRVGNSSSASCARNAVGWSSTRIVQYAWRGGIVQSYRYPYAMDLIVAPIAELRPRLTHLFEERVGQTLDRGTGQMPGGSAFACGVTGGSTALIFLGALREASVDWSRVTLYWGDERAVPPDHPDSNYGLAEQVLLQPLAGHAPNAVRMAGEAGDIHAAAAAYEARLKRDLGDHGALDLIILGIGDDGHVCSLFPGHPALAVDDRLVIAIDDSPKPPPSRITLTLPFVLASRAVWIVAVGPRKLPVLAHALSRGEPRTPLDLVVRQAQNLTVLTDQELRVK
jgi:6-phosphogluconolactonase